MNAEFDVMVQRLLEDVKITLDVTWEDQVTDRKLAGWTRAGINYLDTKAGEQMDYTQGSDEWALLMEYVRYARDAALDVFETNYRPLILSMQHEKQMDRQREEAGIGETSSVETGQPDQPNL